MIELLLLSIGNLVVIVRFVSPVNEIGLLTVHRLITEIVEVSEPGKEGENLTLLFADKKEVKIEIFSAKNIAVHGGFLQDFASPSSR